VVGYPPIFEMAAAERRELHEALPDADSFEDLPGKWQAAILKAEQSAPKPVGLEGLLCSATVPRRTGRRQQRQ
jgi:hypothetical protein